MWRTTRSRKKTLQTSLVSICASALSHGTKPQSDESDEESDSEPEPEPEEENAPPPLGKDERNSQLTVGYKGDRSYVVRGDKIGVFAHTGDHEVKYHASIGHLATPKGKEFAPSHVGDLCLRRLVPEAHPLNRLCCTIRIRR